jgi:hypothetical protein
MIPFHLVGHQPQIWFANHKCGSPTTKQPQLWLANHKCGYFQILNIFGELDL